MMVAKLSGCVWPHLVHCESLQIDQGTFVGREVSNECFTQVYTPSPCVCFLMFSDPVARGRKQLVHGFVYIPKHLRFIAISRCSDTLHLRVYKMIVSRLRVAHKCLLSMLIDVAIQGWISTPEKFL